MNNYAVINEKFNIKKIIEQHPEKWFSHIYGSEVKYNIRLYEDAYMTGMQDPHSVIPLLKESFRQMWQDYFKILDETCRSKFRTYQDVTIYLAVLWSIFQGNFFPVLKTYYGPLIELSKDTIQNAILTLQKANSIAVCLNDGDKTQETDIEEIRNKLVTAFSEKFPDKSSFEL